MSDQEVFSLLRHPKMKALVSLTRGEGFGLPLLEAAACGLPVVATAWSAHTEFLGLGKYIEIEYALSEIHPSRVDNKIFMPGSRWANANEESFKRKIRKFYTSSSTPKQWATELQPKILEKYSHAAITAQYENELKGVL
jgi:glycosyltransferase involved in cell wall biosynthesis